MKSVWLESVHVAHDFTPPSYFAEDLSMISFPRTIWKNFYDFRVERETIMKHVISQEWI